MRLKFKEDPREWRKSALLTLLGMALITSLLRWRHHITQPVWLMILGALSAIALATMIFPRWFRGYYRWSLIIGFYSSQFLGRCVLLLFFIIIMTPFGLIRRWLGTDTLQLQRNNAKNTYWHPSKPSNPLDRLF